MVPNLEAIDSFRYETDVLFLGPWPDIYKTDAERIMSYNETVSFAGTLREVYQRSGYSLVDVPQARSRLEQRSFGRSSNAEPRWTERAHQNPEDALS